MTELVRIAYSNILKCFDDECIGTKVMNEDRFMAVLELKLANSGKFDEHGHAFLNLPAAAGHCSPGDIIKTGLKASDFVVREWRGEVGLYAKRPRDLKAETVSAIVYTLEAYLEDPEVSELEKNSLLHQGPEGGYTHVLVAVLASMGAPTALSSSRLVRNLAGGNAAFIPKTEKFSEAVRLTSSVPKVIDMITHDLKLLHKVIDEAKKTVEFEKNWVTVAD